MTRLTRKYREMQLQAYANSSCYKFVTKENTAITPHNYVSSPTSFSSHNTQKFMPLSFRRVETNQDIIIISLCNPQLPQARHPRHAILLTHTPYKSDVSN